ncbi:GNAT family N-acetyltransferase [Pedobacter sp. NJ-S-72]
MLETQRLLLRRATADDLQSLFDIYGDPETNLSNPAGPLTSLEEAEKVLQKWIAHWNTQGFGTWAISLKEDPDSIIGFGGLSLKKYGIKERLNLGYRFATTAWGKGYATEMCLANLDYAFQQLKQSVVYAVVRPENTASIKVLKKIGMLNIDALDDVPGKPYSLIYKITG